jgi:predicted permease
MRQLRAWFLRLGGLFKRERRDRELAAEMESHLQLHIEENLRSGMTPEEARRQALIKLGGMEQVKEKYRERRGLPLLETLMQDLRYALRLLRKNPGFTIVAVLTLALGIGANSAVFSAVNAVLLRPLPYPDSDRLMMAFLENPKNESGRSSYGVADFLAARDRQQSFSHFAGISLARKMFTYTGGQEPIQVRGTAATADFFRVLGVEPLLGRTFTPGSDQPGKPREVVLSYGFWRSHFGSDPEIVGRTMFIDGDSCTIVAVMPAGFHFGPRGDDDLWPLLQLVPQNARPPFWIAALGRLKPGITEAQAQADLSHTAALVQQQFPGSTSYQSARLQGMKPFMVGDARLALYTLLGGVLLVLLIATVNVANLQVARATMREGEMAIRAALGAGRRRIIRQLLTESLLLAAVGGSLGLLLAAWGTTALLRLNPRVLPRMKEIHVDSQVLAFTAVVALFSGIVFGLTPVLHRFGSGLSESLKGQAGSPGENRGRRKLLASLVVVEFALALLLLTGAGLLIRSFDRLSSTRPGFSPEHLITMKLSLPSVRYSQETQVAGFHQQLLDSSARAARCAVGGYLHECSAEPAAHHQSIPAFR